jgi:hypothetical protein
MAEVFIWIFFILIISPVAVMGLMWLAGIAFGLNQVFKVHPAIAILASLVFTWFLFS